ncbi:hypothetical protein KIL84_021418 [Mauremys mutica]|uniref:Uncharacterized protein n=1 Tax=Mauremys mutica TaxID=74926 RepID=A0A9D4AYZ4_9SAUR|nr:hypothetical protein KIL84_021418 [Mauremys mutica]
MTSFHSEGVRNAEVPPTVAALSEFSATRLFEQVKPTTGKLTAPHQPRCSSQGWGKLEKYAPLADTLRSNGYEVCTDALIVGALGAWDPCNERVLWTCGVGGRYARLMRRLMVSDTIRWSRDIYTEHITGHRQYQE